MPLRIRALISLPIAALIVCGWSARATAADPAASRQEAPPKPPPDAPTEPQVGSRPPDQPQQPEAQTAQTLDEEDELSLDPLEPDFTIINLPTTLRLPTHRAAFRVTHRFTRPLGAGDFGDLASDLFGLDSGAVIGLELRFAPIPRAQIGIHRTNLGKTIELFAEYNALGQNGKAPIGLAVVGAIEGLDNLQDARSPAIGVVLSRKLGRYAALYVEPIWVGNTNPLSNDLADENNTFLIGVGLRIQLARSVYLTGEFDPRVAGYDPDKHHAAFAFEKQVGGHVFQINFSNAFGTTLAQLARGALNNDDWYLGFNISRKFY